MSSDEIAIRVQGLSKGFQIYETPGDRLKQFVMPRLLGMVKKSPRHYFQEFWALKDVSFEVKKGETVGIIGRNGSGKSTLLQLVCGTLSPSTGTVELNGRVAALLELGSGFNPEFTGRENINMYASVLGLSKTEIEERFDKILEFADIGDFIEQPLKTYSSGMVVRLAFSVIAHVDADILIIDEALSVGDVFFVQKCMRFLREFMNRGTVIFVSHDIGAVQNLSKEVIWLKDGRIQDIGSPKLVTEAYLEDVIEDRQGGKTDNLRGSKIINKRSSEDSNVRDMRLDFINSTNLRMDIEIFPTGSDSKSFGKGGAIVESVSLRDTLSGRELAWVVGGEPVELLVSCLAKTKLYSPIVGFMVKDRLGQTIFADNTFLAYLNDPPQIVKGCRFTTFFHFVMPLMPLGDYSIAVSVAEGTQLDHVQHHWVHDAITFKVHTSMICHGLVGIPMSEIRIECE